MITVDNTPSTFIFANPLNILTTMLLDNYTVPMNYITVPIINNVFIKSEPEDDKDINEQVDKAIIKIKKRRNPCNFQKNWSEDEKKLFEDAYKKYGNKWKKIGELIPSKSQMQLRRYANKLNKIKEITNPLFPNSNQKSYKTLSKELFKSLKKEAPNLV